MLIGIYRRAPFVIGDIEKRTEMGVKRMSPTMIGAVLPGGTIIPVCKEASTQWLGAVWHVCPNSNRLSASYAKPSRTDSDSIVALCPICKHFPSIISQTESSNNPHDYTHPEIEYAIVAERETSVREAGIMLDNGRPTLCLPSDEPGGALIFWQKMFLRSKPVESKHPNAAWIASHAEWDIYVDHTVA